MPSRSLGKFSEALNAAQCVRRSANDSRLRPINSKARNYYLHASLAAYVASWDAYLNNVVQEFIDCIRQPLDVDYATAHERLQNFTEATLRRFNTPNWENSRNLLISCTGYDPINDWNWRRASMNGTQSREFLNEILNVRHSFAHGFAIPAYNWTTTPLGKHQLNDSVLQRIERFLLHLATETDKGLSKFGISRYPNRSVW